jgi:hypothetical protein
MQVTAWMVDVVVRFDGGIRASRTLAQALSDSIRAPVSLRRFQLSSGPLDPWGGILPTGQVAIHVGYRTDRQILSPESVGAGIVGGVERFAASGNPEVVSWRVLGLTGSRLDEVVFDRSSGRPPSSGDSGGDPGGGGDDRPSVPPFPSSPPARKSEEHSMQSLSASRRQRISAFSDSDRAINFNFVKIAGLMNAIREAGVSLGSWKGAKSSARIAAAEDGIGGPTAAPVQDFETVGDFSKPHSMRFQDDRRILTNPKAVEKIKRKLGQTPYNLSLYFVNLPGFGFKFGNGEIHPDRLERMREKGLDISYDPNSITVAYLGNRADQRMPMTAWTIAHRLGHALQQTESFKWFEKAAFRQASELAEKLFGDWAKSRFPRNAEWENRLYSGSPRMLLRRLFESIGTMGSARKGVVRTPLEFLHEAVAQYIIQGSVKLQYPKELYLRTNWGRRETIRSRPGEGADPEAQERLQALQAFESWLNGAIGDVLDNAVGSAFAI